jgi:LysM repeat protein
LRENPGANKQNKNLKHDNKETPRKTMNTPSPLLPQGALPPKAKSSVYFKILMVLGIHVVVIGGLLLQGCKDVAKDSAKDSTKDATSSTTVADQASPNNNPAPASAPAPALVDTAPAVPTANTGPVNPSVGSIPSPMTQPAATQPVTPAFPSVPSTTPATAAAPATSGGRDYVIAKGDTLAAIAHKNGISVRALQEANAGVNPRKLQVGQKLQIPAGGAAAVAAAAAPAAAPDAGGAGSADTTVYTVKPGDMLLKIAKAHGTRVKTIMELNDLKTTSIRVGQKLKLPSKVAVAELPAPASPSTQTAAAPAPAPTAN